MQDFPLPEPDPRLTPENRARSRRDILLSQSDWTQLIDVPMESELQEAWSTYRQALRDITSQPDFPDTIEWPEKPA